MIFAASNNVGLHDSGSLPLTGANLFVLVVIALACIVTGLICWWFSKALDRATKR